MLLAEASKENGWWESYSEVNDGYSNYIGHEEAATRLRDFRGSMIPGTLQTRGYLEEHIRVAANVWREAPYVRAEIDNRAAILERRQLRLSGDNPMRYECYLDEAVVMRPVGTRQVFAEQLEHLITMQQRPNISIRIIPFSAGAHPGQVGGFSYFTIPSLGATSDVVYVESVAGQFFLVEATDPFARFEAALARMAEISCSEDATVELLRLRLESLNMAN